MGEGGGISRTWGWYTSEKVFDVLLCKFVTCTRQVKFLVREALHGGSISLGVEVW